MLRWFRLLVIALLLPAYGLAAIVTPSFPDANLAASANSATSDEPATPADVAALIAELGDTSDDMSDHCLPHALVLAAPQPPAAPASLGRRLSIDPPRAPPLRPPRA